MASTAGCSNSGSSQPDRRRRWVGEIIWQLPQVLEPGSGLEQGGASEQILGGERQLEGRVGRRKVLAVRQGCSSRSVSSVTRCKRRLLGAGCGGGSSGLRVQEMRPGQRKQLVYRSTGLAGPIDLPWCQTCAGHPAGAEGPRVLLAQQHCLADQGSVHRVDHALQARSVVLLRLARGLEEEQVI